MRAKNVQRSSRRPAKSVESSEEIKDQTGRSNAVVRRDQRARANAGDAVGVATLEAEDALAVELATAGVACTRSASVSGAQLRGLALYQGHATAVKGELSALENLALNSALDAPTDSARPDGAQHREPPMVRITEADLMRVLTTVGLRRQHAIEARRLSQGQRQRLQLARFALGLESDARPVWLMDEPSAALDDAGTQVLQDLLDAHLQRGGGALIATHLPLAVKAGQRRGLALQDWAPARERTALRDRALTA